MYPALCSLVGEVSLYTELLVGPTCPLEPSSPLLPASFFITMTLLKIRLRHSELWFEECLKSQYFFFDIPMSL